MNERIKIRVKTPSKISIKAPIAGIAKSGGIEPSGTIDITSNGVYNVKYYEFVNINVPIPEGYIKPQGELEITENNTFDVTQYASVKVNVNSDSGSDITPDDTELPNDYVKLNYIQGNGEQYIDTNFNMTIKSKLEISFEMTEYNTTQKMGILGSYESLGNTATCIYQLYCSGTGNQIFYSSFGGTKYIATQKFYKDTFYKVLIDVDKIDVNGNVFDFEFEQLNNATKPLYLFYRNDTGIKANMKLYSCKIYDNDILVRNFVPCYRELDNIVGLYDLVENKFYGNKGAGTFAKG